MKLKKLILGLSVSLCTLTSFSQFWFINQNVGVNDTIELSSNTGNYVMADPYDDAIRFEINNDSILKVHNDSVSIYKYINTYDSIYCKYLIDIEGNEQWAFFTSTGALTGDSMVNAGIGLIDKLIPVTEYLNIRVNGEIGWKIRNGNIVYDLSNQKPGDVLYAYQWQMEHILRYLAEIQNKKEYKFGLSSITTDTKLLLLVTIVNFLILLIFLHSLKKKK